MTDRGFRLRDLREPSALWRADSWLARRSTLWDGERELGKLRFEGLLSRRAVLTTGGGDWRFRMQGWRGWRALREDPAMPEELIYRPGWFSPGRLSLPGGIELRWRHVSLWSGIWAWCLRDEQVLRFRRRSRSVRPAYAVSWGAEVKGWEELDALAGFGWLLVLDHRRRSARHG